MVCCEISSIHYRTDHDVDMMLGCAIFGDGAGAMVLGRAQEESYGLEQQHSGKWSLMPRSLHPEGYLRSFIRARSTSPTRWS